MNIVHTYAPTFEVIFTEILQPVCGGPFCHVGTSLFFDAADRDGAYATLVGAVTSSPGCGFTGLTRVAPGHPERSLLYLKLTDPPCGRKMPLTFAGTLDPREIDQVRLWIEHGAPRYEPNDGSVNGVSGGDAAIPEAPVNDASPLRDASPFPG